ncbi:hypothetical protein IEO21_10041 [Rhodonia placenta]|uniref:Uncharacterized protein n=1 Tax=Rhodonia placenta TaxID=104341 RepID=A0A8H7NT68_9APHY|nr:hypothetical protein IEO21_10041 [Postia placenta]
MLPSIRPLS